MNAEQEARLIAALRGIQPDDSPTSPASQAAQAGLRLRALVLSEMQADAEGAAKADDVLIARLRAQGAFTHRAVSQPRWRWPTVRWLLLPSLATALGVSVLMLRAPAPPLDDQASQMRGAEQVQRIAVADPAAWVAELQALFAAHQLALRRVDLPGEHGIELQAQLPASETALRQALAERHVTVPPHGRLFLRVVKAQQ